MRQETAQMKKVYYIIYLTRLSPAWLLSDDSLWRVLYEVLVLYFDWSELVDSSCSFDSASEFHLAMKNVFFTCFVHSDLARQKRPRFTRATEKAIRWKFSSFTRFILQSSCLCVKKKKKKNCCYSVFIKPRLRYVKAFLKRFAYNK